MCSILYIIYQGLETVLQHYQNPLSSHLALPAWQCQERAMTATSVRRYISDENFPRASCNNLLARGHWSIENQLHWCLDVRFMEDASRARKKYVARNLSVIWKLALQIIKCMDDKSSLKKRRFKASLSSDYFIQLLLEAKIWCGCPDISYLFMGGAK